MFLILIRVIITFIIVLALIRLMGKRQIGELQPFELVITLIVADVATLPISEPSIPLLNGIIPLVTLVILQYAISFFSRKSISFRKIINGQPVIVIDNNGINYKNLKSLNMSINDLQEALRENSVFNFDKVQYAIIETNGKASVILKSEEESASKKDLHIKSPDNSLPILIVSEGKIIEDNLKITKLSKIDILSFLKQQKISNIEDILFMNIDNNGKVYLQPKNSKNIVCNYNNFNGGLNW